MRWRPLLGQWQSIEENAPTWQSVIQADRGLSPAERPRPSMFDAFKPRPEPGAAPARAAQPSMFPAFRGVPEPAFTSVRRAQEAPKPSMFEAFKQDEQPSGSPWEHLFGPPSLPEAPQAPAGRRGDRGLVFSPALAGAWRPKPFPWALGAAVVGVGAFFVLELSGVTNIFGTRASS